MENLNTSDLIERFLIQKELAESKSKVTLQNYRRYLQIFRIWLGKKSITSITADHILSYHIFIANRLGRDGKPLSDKSRREYFVALRSFIKYLNKNDVPTISAEKIDIPKATPPKIIPLTKEEVAKILHAFSGDDLISLRNRAILEVLYSTGARISEILNVNRDEIDLKMGEFSVMGKGKRPRPVFLSERAIEALEAYLNKRTDNFRPLFIDHSTNARARKTGARLTRRSASMMLRETAKSLGIKKKVTPHKIRHSIATHMLQDKVDIRTIQRFLGHNSLKSTEIYTHVTDHFLKEVVVKFHKKHFPNERIIDVENISITNIDWQSISLRQMELINKLLRPKISKEEIKKIFIPLKEIKKAYGQTNYNFH